MIQFRRTVSASAAALLAVVGLTPNSASAESVRFVSLQTGHSVIEKAPSLTRLAVGDPSIAGVVPVGTSEFVINGKKPGHTTIFAWQDGERVSYEITVSDQSIDEVARVLRTAIGVPTVEVASFGQTLVVKGSVADDAVALHVADVLKRFNGVSFGGGSTTVVNAVTVTEPMGSAQTHLTSLPGLKGVKVENDSDGNVVVSGAVHTRMDAEAALAQARGMSAPFLKSDGKVIDRLTVETTSQIDVKVYVLEVDKTAQSNIGMRLGTAQAPAIGSAPVLGNGSSFTAIENPPRNPFNLGPFTRVSFLAPTIDLMLSSGHARLLSSPDLVSIPGTAASFLVGGSIPIPVSNGLGSVSISYKDYGVQLNVTPTLLGNGSIETKINPQVSELDFGAGIQLNGFSVPGLKTSSLTTDVITRDGESVILGGLLRRVESKNIQKIPFLSSLPILGKLFTSTSYQKTDSDVIFVMTPTVITR